MADFSVKTIKHLGPYEIGEIDDDILGNVVYKREIPVVIKQRVGGSTHYAVLAKDKNFRIACAGCFTRDMRITDATRCKKCSSFGKHHDTKDGLRISTCKGNLDILKAMADASKEVVIDTDADDHAKFRDAKFRESVLDTAERHELIKACKAQGLRIVEDLDDDDLVQVCVEERGILMLRGARPTRLIHELRRQYAGASEEKYYGDKGGCEDTVGCDILVPPKCKRAVKLTRKRKAEAEAATAAVHYAPRTVYDFNVDTI